MKVFIDMDGVLCDYNTAIHELFGVSNVYDNPENLGTFSLASILEKQCGISKAQFYKSRGPEFYARLRWTKEGPEILRLLEAKFGKKNCRILSAPGFNPCDYSGKAEWVINNMPDYMYQKRFLLSSDKSLLADEDSILVDDKDSNISEFKRAGGSCIGLGRGILVARPWNAKYGFSDNTLEDFKLELDGIDV